MRGFSAETRIHLHAPLLSEQASRNLQAAAFYAAFAVIVAVVFGTLSFHPF